MDNQMNGRSGRPDIKNKDFKVKFHDNYRGLNGKIIRIEDLWINVSGKAAILSALEGNIAAYLFIDRIMKFIKESEYSIREEARDDTKILYGHIDGLGYLILMSELEEE